MYEVNVKDRTGRARPLVRKLDHLLHASMKRLHLGPSEVSLILVNDPFMMHLNRTFLRKNRPTDVLSFAQGKTPWKRKGKGRSHLGDIIISVTTARKQARKAKKKIDEECALLAVHGLLHLLGHDHAESKEKKIMFDLQAKLLKRAGYA